MKPWLKHPTGFCGDHSGRQSAFTLIEVLIAATIFLMVVGAVIATNFFGVRMMQLVIPRLQATDKLKTSLRQMSSDVASAKIIRIGTGTFGSFSRVADGALKWGNAVQIYPSTDTNVYTRYYQDSGDQKLKRMTNGAASASIVANAVTNTQVFSGEDGSGNVLTNNQNNMVIGVTLRYSRLEGSGSPLGPSNYFKSFQLRTWMTHRPR